MPMDPDWMVWHQNPRKPQYIAPEGAVDAHCHISDLKKSSLIQLNVNTHRVLVPKMICLLCVIIWDYLAMSLFKRLAMAETTTL